ncbi:MAG: EscU/YscU/HrcU family type III secretion system export apparatus switch protein [Planctomycetota bacterium]
MDPNEARAQAQDGAEDAPPPQRVIARGRGEVATRVLAAAIAAGVPVRRDRDLAQLLAAVDLGEELPAETYDALAKIVRHLRRLNAEVKARLDAAGR